MTPSAAPHRRRNATQPSRSDDALHSRVLDQLRTMFGPSLPALLRMRRTTWHDDPFARGA
jgi:hypothetical protein